MIQARTPPSTALKHLLLGHPKVELLPEQSKKPLEFFQNGWARAITIDDPTCEPSGLIELIDNNPLVCADTVSVPGPAATLALIALGPALRAGLVLEAPSLLMNADVSKSILEGFLSGLGWEGGLTIDQEERDLGSVLGVTAIAVIRDPGGVLALQELYAESYSRSFYVRADQDSAWVTELVAGRPWAVYKMHYAPDHGQGLLSVYAMADREGKCGAAQVIHTMNIMCGLEESFGISEQILSSA